MNTLNTVQQHYTAENLPGRLDAALRDAGFGEGRIEWAKLAPIDQFHARGMEATKEVAEALEIQGGESVLDIGCGFGGPARFLAGQYGCYVTGIDLTPAYIEIAKTLAQRTGLSERLTFVQGDALDLPFPDESYDAAWMMHVGMNIQDKERLYAGIHRVLRPGGRLAVYDILSGSGEPLTYPLPWARTPETSFPVTEEEVAQALRAAGFGEVASTDRTPQMMEWMAGLRAAQAAQGSAATLAPAAPGLFNLVAMVLGPDAVEINANVAQNLKDGRARIAQVVVQKD